MVILQTYCWKMATEEVNEIPEPQVKKIKEQDDL